MSAGKCAFVAGVTLLAMSSFATAIAGETDIDGQSDTFSVLLANTADGNLQPPQKSNLDTFAEFEAIDSIELDVTKASDLESSNRSVPVRAISVRIGLQDAVIHIRKDAVLVPRAEADALFDVETTVASGERVALLTGRGIDSMIVGNTLTGFARGGWWSEYYAPDGQIFGKWRGSRYLAKWTVEGKMMCFHYPEQRTYCLMHTVVGDQVFFHQPDGTGGRKGFKLLPGNPFAM